MMQIKAVISVKAESALALPCEKAAVNKMVAIADPPHDMNSKAPITASDNLPIKVLRYFINTGNA